MIRKIFLFSFFTMLIVNITGCSTSAGGGLRESLDTKYVTGKVNQSYEDVIKKKGIFGKFLLQVDASDGDDVMVHTFRMKGLSGPFFQAYLYKVWALKVDDNGNMVDWARAEYDNEIRHISIYGMIILGQKAQEPKDMEYIKNNYASMIKTSSGGSIEYW